MNRTSVIIAGFLPLILAACRDYGEFTVAEPRWVSNEDFPALSEIDLRDINIEFSIGSELHARLLPDAYWPEPILSLIRQVKIDNGGVLPDAFDLPIPDACIYVDINPKSSRFKRIQAGSRQFLFVSTLESVNLRTPQVADDSNNSYQPKISIFEERREPNLLGSIDIESMTFDAVIQDDIAYVFSPARGSLFMTRIDLNKPVLHLDSKALIFETDSRIEKIETNVSDNFTFDVGILTDRYSNRRERNIFFSRFSVDRLNENNFALISDTASSPAFFMYSEGGKTILSWIDARFIERGFFETDNPGKVFVYPFSDAERAENYPMVLNLPFDDTDNAEFPLVVSHSEGKIFAAWGIYQPGVWPEGPMRMGVLRPMDGSVSVRRSPVDLSVIRSEAKVQHLAYQRSVPVSVESAPDSEYCDTWRDRIPDSGFRVLHPVTRKPVRPWP